MMNKRNFLVLCLSLLNILSLYAQQIKISGRLLNLKNVPIEYANVQLLNKDSVFITGTTSNQDGKVELRAVANQDYRLSFSAIGYESKTMYLQGINAHTNLGNIILEESTVALDDITITANQIVRQIDRQIAFPNALQSKSATNALEVLRNMSLPQLEVDVQQRSVKLVGNRSVELRINGVPVSINEVYALQPQEIVRVEFYDSPGARLQSDALVDFIVRRKTSGGYVSTDLLNTPYKNFGFDMLSAKLNHKNSEWSAIFNTNYQSNEERYIQSTTTYHFPDKNIIKTEDGIPAPFKFATYSLNLGYNYTQTDVRVVDITLSGNLNNQDQYSEAISSYSNAPEFKNFAQDNYLSHSKQMALDIYYKENISQTQNLQFNLTGSYINSDYNRNYIETNENEGLYSSSKSSVDGDKYALIGEANHRKQWNKFLLYSGIRYQFGYANNKYNGTLEEKSELKNKDLYVYTQLNGQWKKWYYGIGIGLSNIQFDDLTHRYSFWSLRPRVSLYYAILQNLSVQYTLNVTPINPELSALSDVSQIINRYEIRKGNPNLKSHQSYFNQIQITYQKGTLRYWLGMNDSYQKKAIMGLVYYDPSVSMFVQTSANQRYYHATGINGNIYWQIVPDMLAISLQGSIMFLDSKGIDYHYKRTVYYGGANLNFNYKRWSAFVNIASRNKNMYGEVYSTGALQSAAEVGYRYKSLYMGIRTLCFLSNTWDAGSESFSKVMSNNSWTYIKDSAPIFAIHLSWNMAWGRKSKSAQKELNNKDTDTGILKANK